MQWDPPTGKGGFGEGRYRICEKGVKGNDQARFPQLGHRPRVKAAFQGPFFFSMQGAEYALFEAGAQTGG
ncbi:hypothetical protein BGS_0843 [Beggiatoa sp. SS]|nr:hypothetical protein BGS_0843 [Beggiatoa sp. SS]